MKKEDANGTPKKGGEIVKKVWGRLTYRPFWQEYGYMALCMLIPAKMDDRSIVPKPF